MSAVAPGGAVPGVRIGSVLGVPVHVSPSWLLLAALVVVTFGPALGRQHGELLGYVGAALFALLLLASVLLHEIGHCVVARAFDLPVRSISVTFLAGLTEISEPPQTPAREYAVAVVGPTVSLLLAGLGWAGRDLLDPQGLAHQLSTVLAVSNGLVALFNFLPGLPLDGGRVVRAAAWQLTGDPERSTVVAAWAGRAVGVVLLPALLLGVLPAIGVTRLTLTSVLFTLLMSAFVYAGATAALQSARLRQRLPRATVRGLARTAIAVAADLPLSEAVRRAQSSGVHAVVVVDSAGAARAVVSEAAVLAVPEERRPWVPVSSVARTVQDDLRLDPSLTGERLLEAMRRNPASEYLVDDGVAGARAPQDGSPFRVLVAADVARAVDPQPSR